MRSLVSEFMNFLVNLKVYHWKTTSYARHKASDDCHTKLQALVDQFVEVALGKFPRKKLLGHMGTCTFLELTDDSVVGFMSNFANMLLNLHIRDPDLLNIRDEMVGNLNQCLYLFTLD